MEIEQKENFILKQEINYYEEYSIFKTIPDIQSQDNVQEFPIKSEFPENNTFDVIKLEEENATLKIEPTEEVIVTNEVIDNVDVNEYVSDFVKRNLLIEIMGARKLFCCPICQYKTPQKSNLVRHFRTHSQEKPFACHLCTYKSSQKAILQKHIGTHSSEKPFECDICFSKFTRKCSLTRHLDIHREEKPFECEFCDYRSAQKTNLLSHMRVHCGEKPYRCRLCLYRSSHKSHLNRHMKTHYKQRKVEVNETSSNKKYKECIVTND